MTANAFNFAQLHFAWLPILPLIVLAVTAMVVLLVGARLSEEEGEGLGWLSLVGLVIAFIFALGMIGPSELTFSGALVVDNFSAYFFLILLFAAAVTVLMSLDYVAQQGLPGAEYYALLLFATIGMLLMAAAGDLIIIFLGLETMSIAVYVMAGLARRDPKSNEAALKYFLLGAFSTGFLLYGIAFIYGATGSVKLAQVSAAMGHSSHQPLLLLGVGLLLIGFAFKVAAVPFHMWTPDVYEGAPTSVTAFMAVGVKLAAFAGFVRVFMVHLPAISPDWSWVLWVIAALTVTAGNTIALLQTNLKRLLAYSAIAHAGYMLVAMTAGGIGAGGAVLYYLLGYAFTNLGAFAILIALARQGEPNDRIDDLRGLATRHPILAAAMTLLLLSLVGVPPLAGFVGKFYLFSAALSAGYVWLVVIAVVNSVISAYYYLTPVVAMYAGTGGVEPGRVYARPALVAAIAIGVAGTIAIGLFPQPYMAAASGAFASAFGKPALSAVALFH
ncbi:MAG TPA: NADH-quinone oxidoreductase subunit N [Candidatus Binataceae bacterium]|nr:NADH-quinone oxidoreductase subunit N [Candidatus Binataceae bacterium]